MPQDHEKIAYFRLNQQGAYSAIACIGFRQGNEFTLVEPKARNMMDHNIYDIMPADSIPNGAAIKLYFGTSDNHMHEAQETYTLDRACGYVAEYGSWGTAALEEWHLNNRYIPGAENAR
jgi:hypothetical protein